MSRTKSFLLFFLLTALVLAQETKPELVGHVIDVVTNGGIEGVRVQLLSQPDIVHTDSEGKYIFRQDKGYRVGQGYSVLLYKEGYISTMSTDNLILNENGVLKILAMKSEFEKFLWLTVKDGLTGAFLSNVTVEIQGEKVVTNELGRAKFDFSRFGKGKATALLKRECYKDETVMVDLVGDEEIKMIRICQTNKDRSNHLDVLTATKLFDRALEVRNGSSQGQVAAIQYLRENGYDFNSVNFEGVNLRKLQLPDTNFGPASFDFADLSFSNFSKGKLSKSRFYLARANNADFNQANLSHSVASFMPAQNINFKGADLSYAYFIGCDFSNADFSGANMEGTLFALCNLSGAKFDNTVLTNAGLSGCVLDGASFTGAEISNTDITGSVAPERQFGFTTEQKAGLCTYVDDYRRGSVGNKRLEFKFQLTEERNSTYSKYKQIVTEYGFFESFGGSNCKICESEKWASGKWRDYYSHSNVTKHETFLRKDNRVSNTRTVVKKHLDFLQKKLITQNTYRIESDFEKWDKKITAYYRTKNLANEPVLDLDLLTMQIIKNKLMPHDKIPWKLLAYRHLTNKIEKELDKNTVLNAKGFNMLTNVNTVPPIFTVTSMPQNWIDDYKSWIIKDARSAHKLFYLPFSPYGLQVKPGHATFSFRKGPFSISRRYKEGYTDLMEKNNIDPDYTRAVRIENSDYYSTNTSRFSVRYHFPDSKQQYTLKIPEGADTKGLKIRLQLKYNSMRLLHSEEGNAYLVCDVTPLAFEYLLKDGKKWAAGYIFDSKKKTSFESDKIKSLKNRAILNNDVLLAIMLKNGLLTLDDFRMSTLAYKHLEKARSFKYGGEPFPYQYIFPDHTPKRSVPFNYVEKYSNWLSQNISIGVETFCIDLKYKQEVQEISGSNQKIGIALWSDKASYSKTTTPHNYLKESQVERNQAVSYSRLMAGISRKIDHIVLVYPKNKRIAFFEVDRSIKKEDVQLRLELKLEKIDYIQKVTTYAILYVKPLALYYKAGKDNWKTSTNFID